MRFSIIIAAVLISDAIRNQPALSDFYSDSTCVLIGIVTIIALFADIVDFIRTSR